MIQLQLETTSTCNAACVFCVYPTAHRHGMLMSMELFRKIVDDAKTVPLISEICLTGLGEPTLDPLLVDRIAYIHGRLPYVHIGIFTNGVFLGPTRFDQLRDAGLKYVVFSLNAVRPEQHEAQMGLKGKFDAVCANIDHAIRDKSMIVEVRAVVDPRSWPASDSALFYERWGHRSNGGYGQLIYEGNWAGSNHTIRKFDPAKACGRAFTHIYVLADGRVTTCCFDPTGEQVFGDLNRQTIREIHNSGPYVEFRRAHSENKADRYGICAGCSRI